MEQELRKCKYCGRELPIDQFSKSSIGTLKSVCKECCNQRVQEGRKKKKNLADLESQIIAAKKTRLQDYSGRELITELARRGYKGKLVMTVEKEIDITNF